jgi:hypothetical protein
MRPIKPRESHPPADVTGWLLGTIIVVLTVLDLLIWATLWNVPSPISKLLAPQAGATGRPPTAALPFDDLLLDEGAQTNWRQ